MDIVDWAFYVSRLEAHAMQSLSKAAADSADRSAERTRRRPESVTVCGGVRRACGRGRSQPMPAAGTDHQRPSPSRPPPVRDRPSKLLARQLGAKIHRSFGGVIDLSCAEAPAPVNAAKMTARLGARHAAPPASAGVASRGVSTHRLAAQAGMRRRLPACLAGWVLAE